MAENQQEKLYTVKEVARILQCDPVTVRRKIEQDKLAAFKLDGDGGPWRIRYSALEAFMDASKQMVEVR